VRSGCDIYEILFIEMGIKMGWDEVGREGGR